MTQVLDEAELLRALGDCARKPVREIPTAQTFAAVLAARRDTGIIEFVSDNLHDLCGLEASGVLGRHVHDMLGSEVLHALNNRATLQAYTSQRMAIGDFDITGTTLGVSAFGSGDHHIIEIEAMPGDGSNPTASQEIVAPLVRAIRHAESMQPMLETTVRLLRIFSGFDRVLVYKFDQEFNGAVVAEDRNATLAPFLGLRFPHADIPPQVRAVMMDLPLRMIHDTASDPVQILAADPDAPPVDITLAHARGVSAVHLQYLRNMDVRTSLTLSVVVDNRLWGMIGFHNRRIRRVDPDTRTALEDFLLFFNMKMSALENRETVALIERIEAAKVTIFMALEEDRDLAQAFDKIGPILLDAFDAQGVASLSGSQSFQAGRVPGPAVLERLFQLGNNRPSQVVPIDALAATYPSMIADLNGAAGALVASTSKNLAIAFFREETVQQISWAGKPDKTLAGADAGGGLQPRASFACYVEQVRGRCTPWTEQDLQLARGLSPIVNAAERQVLLNTANRHQRIMIDELNHRVRNILALVRAVSRQARQRYTSLDAYAESMEARIHALAAAHDIGQGAGLEAIPVRQIIENEIGPFDVNEPKRTTIRGVERGIAPEIAPIFALIVHELVTNAAKYGALSGDAGTVTVTLAEEDDGLRIDWKERGGPKVTPPRDAGFGTVLIEHAVPHELGGRAALFYDPDGVRAEIFVPLQILRDDSVVAVPAKPARPAMGPARDALPTGGLVLLVEDNFIIAKEMVDQIRQFGFSEVEVCSNVEDALELLDRTAPVISILDINLGSGKTSRPIADRLQQRNLPFIFATGYGETGASGIELDDAPIITKPVSAAKLRDVMATIMVPDPV